MFSISLNMKPRNILPEGLPETSVGILATFLPLLHQHLKYNFSFLPTRILLAIALVVVNQTQK